MKFPSDTALQGLELHIQVTTAVEFKFEFHFFYCFVLRLCIVAVDWSAGCEAAHGANTIKYVRDLILCL